MPANQVKHSELATLATVAINDRFVLLDVSATKSKTATCTNVRAGLGLTGANVDDETLIAWCANVMQYVTARTYAADGLELQSGTLAWPDGSAGTLTVVSWNASWYDVDSWTATHSDSSKTVTLATVTRNTVGEITNMPQLSVTT